MPEVTSEPYMIWKCPHKTALTATTWGVNAPPECQFCLGKEMDYVGAVPKGCAYVWWERKDIPFVGVDLSAGKDFTKLVMRDEYGNLTIMDPPPEGTALVFNENECQ